MDGDGEGVVVGRVDTDPIGGPSGLDAYMGTPVAL